MAYQAKYLKPSTPVALGSVMMRIASVLLILVMLSTHMMSGLYARYTTTGSGQDDARVAKFQVDVTGDADVAVEWGAVRDNVYLIQVENKSEVAVECTLGVQLLGDAAANGVSAAFDQPVLVLPVGGNGTAELTFEVDWNSFTQNVKQQSSREETFSFDVTVKAVQVD